MENRMVSYKSIEWKKDHLVLLDQRKLPRNIVYMELRNYKEVAKAIKNMVVRGAPAIGATAAYGMVLAILQKDTEELSLLKDELTKAAALLRASRPTAVNLFWAIDRIIKKSEESSIKSVSALQRTVLTEANNIAREDIETNKQICLNALELFPEKVTFIHHCNTGALATVDYGTALGIIRIAHEHGRDVFVYVDETRPRLQGARLTSWELKQLGIKHKVIVDGASGYIMANKKIDLVTVGADRVVRNGDTANKIGTYNLAIVAKAHDVPFYVVAPTSTIDLNISEGNQIEIEERPSQEITNIMGQQITPDDIEVANPAFDVTPAKYITGIITEMGIAYPSYKESLTKMVNLAEKRRNK